MKNSLKILVAIVILSLAACGGGGEDGDLYADPIDNVSYINWTGSSNGTSVVDATNDAVKFRSDTGQMVFSNTTFTNITVNSSSGALTFNGEVIGGIYLIRSTAGSNITGMVCSNGYLVDIFGSESDLTLGCSSTYPTYASTATPPTVSSKVASNLSFQVASAARFMNANGGSVTLTARGSRANETTLGLCSGTRTFTDAPASSGATFLGTSALSSVGVSSTTWTNCTPASSSSTGTSYYDSNYNDIGSISQSGRYGVWQSMSLPSTVRVGDVGIVGTQNYYTDATRTVADGRRDMSYVVEADTSTTAVINMISKYYNPLVAGVSAKDGKLSLMTQYKYRLTTNGRMTLIAVDLQYYIAGTNTTAHHYVFGL